MCGLAILESLKRGVQTVDSNSENGNGTDVPRLVKAVRALKAQVQDLEGKLNSALDEVYRCHGIIR